jgi:UDP-glucose 4-epimerase
VNVLVTGGAGYIGSICSEVLIAAGLNVIVLDNLSEGHRAAVPSDAAFFHADLGDKLRVRQIFQQNRIDAVMHFAGEALVQKSTELPSAFYLANVAYGVMLLDEMVLHGVNKLIFSSTCAVYGEPRLTPITEDHPKSPVNPYGKSKLVFEGILADYRSYTGLDYVSLRYFNAAGASPHGGEHHRHETHLIPRILDAICNGSPIEVFGADYPTADGTCVRDYVHVLDIADAHLRALQSIDRFAGSAFNVGTGVGHSILQVIDATRRVTQRQVSHQFSPRRPGDPAVLVASGDKLRRELAWSPRYPSLDDIIASAWTWKQKHPHGYHAPHT